MTNLKQAQENQADLGSRDKALHQHVMEPIADLQKLPVQPILGAVEVRHTGTGMEGKAGPLNQSA